MRRLSQEVPFMNIVAPTTKMFMKTSGSRDETHLSLTTFANSPVFRSACCHDYEMIQY